MSTSADAPTDRILRLAAYAAERTRTRSPITLSDIADDVPGYETNAERDAAGDLVPGTTGWEAVRKKLTRDIGDLRTSWGICLDYDDVEHRYLLAPPFLTRAERTALLAAAGTVAVQGSPRARLGELGGAVDDSTALVIVRLHDLVAELREAIGNRSQVAFDYDGRERRVEPYALGMWRNRWYLAGSDTDAATLRRFRLDRIDATVQPVIRTDGAPGSYAIPDDFDTERAFDLDPNSWGTDPCVRARVCVSPDHVDAFLADLGGEVSEHDGATIVKLDVRHYGSFRTRLLAFGTNAVVLEPPVLVAEMRDHLVKLVKIR